MNGLSKTKRKEVFRIVAASILSSSLNQSDLKRLSDEFEYGLISRELAQFLRQFVTEKTQGNFNHSVSNDLMEAVDEILYTAKRNKLTKGEVLSLLRMTSAETKHLVSSNDTIAENVERVIEMNDLQYVRNLREIMEHHNNRDRYLEGIDDRD